MSDHEADLREEAILRTIKESFQQELSLHGYGFQFRVLKEAKRLAASEVSSWSFRVSEFPVEVRGSSTKIDFILFRQGYRNARADMICECKRASPAISHWCFVRAPFVARNYPKAADPLVFDSVAYSTNGTFLVFARSNNMTRDGYHIAIPIRSGQKGDAQPIKQVRSEIEDAVSQVLRGTNGYIERLAADPQLTQKEEQNAIVRIIPVVFTTANLFVSKADISTADIKSGQVNIDDQEFQRVSWLWYQYNVSPGLKHSARPIEKAKVLEEYMQNEHIRSVAIVSASGIEEFLVHAAQEA